MQGQGSQNSFRLQQENPVVLQIYEKIFIFFDILHNHIYFSIMPNTQEVEAT